jgi:hypothetical protein
MGVFLQPDPIGFKGDAANTYRFCGNNAVNKTDPLGLLVMDHLLGDRMWQSACFFDSGNSFQGSLGDFMQHVNPAGMDGGSRPVVDGQYSKPGPNEPVGTGSRVPSASDAPLRMLPPKETTTTGYERYAYYQLASREGKALAGGDLRFQEGTTRDRNSVYNTSTTDKKPPQPLTRGSLFKDHVGFPLEHRPRGNDKRGETILYQSFKSYYPNGAPGPVISTQFQHVTRFLNDGTVTNSVYVVVP